MHDAPSSLPPLSFEAGGGGAGPNGVEPTARHRRKWRGAVGALIGGGVGAGFGYVFIGPFLKEASTWGSWIGPVFAVNLAAAFIITILAHELGHLAFGSLVGFRPAVLMIGPLMVRRTHGRLRLGLGSPGPVLGGAVVGLWDESAGDYRRRAAVYVSGGPIVSLVGGAGAVAAYSAVGAGGYSPATHAGWQYAGAVLVLFVGVLSLLLGVANLVPFKKGLVVSDGGRLVQLLRWDQRARRDHVFQLVLTMAARTPPREWRDEVVQRCLAEAEGSDSYALASLFAYLQARDRGDFATARGHLQRGIDAAGALPEAQRTHVYLEAAFFELTVRGDRQSAGEWLDRTVRADSTSDDVAAAVQALLHRQAGEEEEAARFRAKALEAFEQDPYEAAANAQRKWFLDAYGEGCG